MKEPILSREEVEGFADRISLPLMDDERDALVREIESAVLEKLGMVPVVKVISWTNGSYHRNYQLQWSRDVEAGMQLYALNRSKA